MSRRILVIEDDRDIAHLVELHLSDLEYEVTVAHDGRSGLEAAVSKPFDLIILDLLLPGMDGIEICKRVRARSSYIPILMLTSRSSEVDRVLGLEMGADDYLTKPFSIPELQARVKALFRREEAIRSEASPEAQRVIEAGQLVIETEKRKVTIKGKEISLTAKEFDLLVQFAKHPGRVYSRAELLNQVWGYGYEGYEHTVNSHINRLRSKIEEDPARPRYVLSVRGIGYKFSDLDETQPGDT
jgi:DNA-binding response OmpR family regulator